MRVLIFGKKLTDDQKQYVELLLSHIRKEQVETFIYSKYLSGIQALLSPDFEVKTVSNYSELVSNGIDFVLTLGGDGTILQAITLVKDSGIPILGINLGRMGFLASIEKRYIGDIFSALKKNQYSLDIRPMLFLESDKPLFGDTRFALNDFTILKRDTSSMIIIHAYLNGDFLNSYWADGLIVATPTGSTGYSLSCGGPILFPTSRNFIITPVAPHNLNVRPIVLPDDSVISFEVEGRTDNFLCSLDSRVETIGPDVHLSVRKCDFSINLIQLSDMSFSRTMREKLLWGYDSRKYS